LGIFYLPFVVALWYNEKYEKKVTRPLTVIFLLMFVTVLLKCLLTGFEYITTTLVMSVTPWIFYAVCNQWSWKSFVKRIVVASSGALSAVLTTLVWLSIQLSFMKGSIGAGFDYIMYSFGKRTYRSEGVEQIFKESTNSNVWDVLTAYWNSYAFDLGHWCANPFWQYICRIRFGSCIIIFFVFTVLILLSQSIDKHPVFRRQQTALSVMLWISMLAPLSWFVIFKGHSYIHTHMNSIVWHMPFMLLGATFVGSAVKFFVRQKKLTDNNIMDNAEQSINNSSGL
jgi:hypothetical protein